MYVSILESVPPPSQDQSGLAINLDGTAGVKSQIQVEDISSLLQDVDGASPFPIEKASTGLPSCIRGPAY